MSDAVARTGVGMTDRTVVIATGARVSHVAQYPIRTSSKESASITRQRRSRRSAVAVSDVRFVDVAPAPVFTGLEGLDDRVADHVGVGPCVPARG